MSDAGAPPPGVQIRRLMRALDRGCLATLARPGSPESGAPYASLVLVAADTDASPILLISRLADHTQNLLADGRASLLFDGTAGLDEPLTGPRATLTGTLAPSAEPRCRARFLARHPGAAMYADFKDFAFYRFAVARAHLVAGFGRIHWVEGREVLRASPPALAEAERDIVAHMNADHADAVQLYATTLLGAAGEGWTMTGIDGEGADLRRGGQVLRLDFDRAIADAGEARTELVRLVERARRR